VCVCVCCVCALAHSHAHTHTHTHTPANFSAQSKLFIFVDDTLLFYNILQVTNFKILIMIFLLGWTNSLKTLNSK